MGVPETVPMHVRTSFLLVIVSLLLSACGTGLPPVPHAESPESATVAAATPTLSATDTQTPWPVITSVQSFQTGRYRNLFQEYLGKTEAEIRGKLDAAWEKLFYGDDDFERVYYPVGDDMAYMLDVGNNDIRSEGMSYGMMISVQLDKQEEFDRLWKWTKTYMYQTDGPYQGYFAWHCDTEGKQLAANPASDGEEWFVTALFFASQRWGDGEGIFNYRAEADQILHTMGNKTEEGNGIATDMFDPESKQVVFVPSGRNSTFTDPSYHLPAYYELWALWAAEENAFWSEAAAESRAFFHRAAHPLTGLMPDYSNFDGTPTGGEHEDFRFDAWRTLSNVAVDFAWFGKDPWQVEQSDRVLTFLASQDGGSYGNQYTLDGKVLAGDHSTGLVAMAGVAALAAHREVGEPFVQELWDANIPRGTWRYYDGLLYLMALLHGSGNFQAYMP
jgi:oligosaccharide reducing-end xylanase